MPVRAVDRDESGTAIDVNTLGVALYRAARYEEAVPVLEHAVPLRRAGVHPTPSTSSSWRWPASGSVRRPGLVPTSTGPSGGCGSTRSRNGPRNGRIPGRGRDRCSPAPPAGHGRERLRLGVAIPLVFSGERNFQALALLVIRKSESAVGASFDSKGARVRGRYALHQCVREMPTTEASDCLFLVGRWCQIAPKKPCQIPVLPHF